MNDNITNIDTIELKGPAVRRSLWLSRRQYRSLSP